MVEREPAYLRGDEDGDESPSERNPVADTTEKNQAPPEMPIVQPQRDPTPRPRTRRPTSNEARRRAAEKRGAPVFYAAGFFRRLAAGLLDLAIIIPVSLIAGWLVGMLANVHLPQSRHRGIDFWLDLVLASDPALFGGLGLTLAIAMVYAFIFQLTTAQTLGMRVLKIRIIDAYGDAPSPSRIIGRTVGYVVSTATLFLGFLWIGFDSEKRGLHDWLSGTYVVKV